MRNHIYSPFDFVNFIELVRQKMHNFNGKPFQWNENGAHDRAHHRAVENFL